MTIEVSENSSHLFPTSSVSCENEEIVLVIYVKVGMKGQGERWKCGSKEVEDGAVKRSFRDSTMSFWAKYECKG